MLKQSSRYGRLKEIVSGVLWLCSGIGILALGIWGLHIGTLYLPFLGGGRIPLGFSPDPALWSLFFAYLCMAVFCVTAALELFARMNKNALRSKVSGIAWKAGIFFFILTVILARFLGQ